MKQEIIVFPLNMFHSDPKSTNMISVHSNHIDRLNSLLLHSATLWTCMETSFTFIVKLVPIFRRMISELLWTHLQTHQGKRGPLITDCGFNLASGLLFH